MATFEPPEVQLRPRLAPRGNQMEVPQQCVRVRVCERIFSNEVPLHHLMAGEPGPPSGEAKGAGLLIES